MVALRRVGLVTAAYVSGSFSLDTKSGKDTEYQRFIDRYPVADAHADARMQRKFGDPIAEKLPGLIGRFDWALGPGFGVEDVRKTKDPQTVYANTASVSGRRFLVHEILTAASTDFDSSHNRRSLVFGDTDTYLSELWPFKGTDEHRAEQVGKLRQYFDRILYQVLDVQTEGVEVMPITLYEPYLRHNQPQAAKAISEARLEKPRKVLAAWGKAWPKIEEEGLHKEEAEKHSRQQARAWVQTAAAQQAGVELRDIEMENWWGELSQYRFLIAPTGLSIQTPKIVEALLVLTVPIVQRHNFPTFDSMVRLGFPMVVLNAWEEITPTKLDEWWAELAPRLESFRKCLTAEGYWALITGSGESECWKLEQNKTARHEDEALARLEV
eukprot:gnl/TRDRNA2_/TRDRNA2_93160_c0_seq1.p1 gnl/TRDRNA2_/TRDRNA2_93160_c0~~gnl/TRDRNA2_/TRDRNA2_93160_c0_seq1.p1  ORF type:complete len:383 (+),score=63.75 gnl/TRDRNA2_/TRDRNA2_93160_c0_seq1:100-1248(+)